MPAVVQWKAVAELFKAASVIAPRCHCRHDLGRLVWRVRRYLGKGGSTQKGAHGFRAQPPGIAFVIPAYYSVSMALGGVIAWALARKYKRWTTRFLIVLAAGVMAGDSLTGVFLAVWDILASASKSHNQVNGRLNLLTLPKAQRPLNGRAPQRFRAGRIYAPRRSRCLFSPSRQPLRDAPPTLCRGNNARLEFAAVSRPCSRVRFPPTEGLEVSMPRRRRRQVAFIRTVIKPGRICFPDRVSSCASFKISASCFSVLMAAISCSALRLCSAPRFAP